MADGPKIKGVTEASCGCVTIEYDEGPPNYKPCLVHALDNAGIMLREAAKRIHEERNDGTDRS